MKRIFVIGKQRSGTTWTANILANHREIAAIQTESHVGIHESGFFSHLMPRFGDIDSEDKYREFVDLFFQTEYALLSGVKKELFEDRESLDYYSFFASFMDEYAKKEGVEAWLEKTPRHTMYAQLIGSHIEDAYYIYVKRDIIGIVTSTMNYKSNKNNYGLLDILRLVTSTVRYEKVAEALEGDVDRFIKITYEDLLRDRAGTCEHLMDFLDLDYDDQLNIDKYKANSSYKKKSDKTELTDRQKRMVKLAYKVLGALPQGLYVGINRAHIRYDSTWRKPKLPVWMFPKKVDGSSEE